MSPDEVHVYTSLHDTCYQFENSVVLHVYTCTCKASTLKLLLIAAINFSDFSEKPHNRYIK